ncbi:hypothetical protein C2E23DRAFT_886686 [Lenzites betulinus]|nr:hypothetical protein C2E23DRAFT_886686 [Lenzites betulinus]
MMNMLSFVLTALLFAQGNAIPLEKRSTTAGEGNPTTITVSHAVATGGVSSSFTHVGGPQVSSSFFSVPTSVFTSVGGTPESDSTTAGEGNPKTITVSHAAATGGVSSSFTHIGGSQVSSSFVSVPTTAEGPKSVFTSVSGKPESSGSVRSIFFSSVTAEGHHTTIASESVPTTTLDASPGAVTSVFFPSSKSADSSDSTTAGEGNPKTVTVSHAAATGGVSSSFTHIGGSQVSSSFFSVPTSVFTSVGGTPESHSTTAGEGNPKTVTVSHAAATGGVSSSFTHVGGSSPSTTGITSIFTSVAGSSPSTISEPVPTTITIHNSPAAAALPTLNG